VSRARDGQKRWDAAEKLPARRRILTVAVCAAGLAIIGRGVELQGFEGRKWAAVAAEQQQARQPLPARRGGIYDREGVPLALTRETFALSVAPREIKDAKAADMLARALGISRPAARKLVDRRRAWVVVPGRFSPEQRHALDSVRGLHWDRQLERFYPQGAIAREVLGGVSADGRAAGGIEQEQDTVLRGVDGYAVNRRDAHGVVESSITLPVEPPRDGSDVYLTIDFELQQIADEALTEAIRTTNAAGGDMLLTDPRTGEVLAAVSKRPGGGIGLGAMIEPYEPGSTIKPFFVASLLAGGYAKLGDRIFGENGSWTMPSGRVLRDVEENQWLTLRDALRVSSNIGMAKFSERIPPAQQYRYLRDFGFGTATGVEYPAEASGRLPGLKQWSGYTPASVAIGYEVAVTPLQLAMAYGALANGGTLMEPHLVHHVRSSAGETVRDVAPRPLRRVVPRAVADSLRRVLASVVEDGTGTRASLSTFVVAGKTGTARRTGAGGRYEADSYNATFAGFFPAQDPQLAIYVKIDRPQGAFYGGVTAAPVSRETFQAILAAHTRALDGRSLLASRLPVHQMAAATAVSADDQPATPSGAEGTYVFLSPKAPAPDGDAPASSVPVPNVAGLSLRDAARRMHALGFHVRLQGGGDVASTLPAAGAMGSRGATVTLVGRSR
jgi:cell division protein FtsI (penicillin-binding protein 3)